MRTFATSFLLVGALLAAVYAYPANSNKGISSDPSDDAEFIVVPLEHQRPSYINRYPSSFDGFDGVLDTDDFPHAQTGPVFFPSINPFSWQFSSYLDDLIKRVRDRFAGSWNPFLGGGIGGGDFVPSGPGLFPIDIPDVDDSAEGAQTNSTSTVKVIDGHKVIINDTYYTKKTDFGTSVFKVRVIDVKPVDSEEGGDSEKPESGSTEKPSVETGNRNGSDADEEEGDGKKEPTTEATPAKPRDTELDSSDEDTTPADDNLNTIDSSKDIDGPKKDELPAPLAIAEPFRNEPSLAQIIESLPELSDSQERNVLRAELIRDREDASSSESTNDDDELFSPDEWKQFHDDRRRIVVGNRHHQLSEQVDLEPTSGGAVDLTNDIAINEMLADQSIPLPADVEVFAPNRRRPAQQDPMQQVPMGGAGFPMGFPVGFPFPGGNRFPVQQFPNQFPVQQFPVQRPPQIGGQFPVQGFPVFPGFGGGQQFPGVQQRPVSGGGQQMPVLMMTFPQTFPAFFREVRP